MSGCVDLVSHFPYGDKIRDIQKSVLEEIGRGIGEYDVIVVVAPTAAGKTAIARTILNGYPSSSYILPNNLLVKQVQEEFPETPTLSRLDSYRCEDWARSCAATKGKLGQFCRGCPAAADLMRVKFRGGANVLNYHIYVAHKAYRQVLVVDEAHNLMPWIRDRLALTIWQHDYGYPSNLRDYDYQGIARWIETLPANKRKHKKIQQLKAAVSYPKPEYIPQFTSDSFNGKGTVRGHPEERNCIKLLPTDISHAPQLFWPGLGKGRGTTDGRPNVETVILLSATIGPKDIEALGLDRYRVLYIQAESPIAAERRPIVIDPVTSVTRSNLESATEQVARYIDEVLAPQHEGEKGVIHVTYQMARLLTKYLTGPRYLFHDRANKKEQYELFRSSPPESGRILVACGMSEGIDLPEDLGRWQVVAKIPWGNLGNPAVRHMMEKDEDSYYWDTARTLIQTCGRICRTVGDYGVTYVTDSTFDRLYFGNEWQFPEWWKEALLSREDYDAAK